MNKPKYYAVRAGRVPGIYETWKECQQQVIHYSNQEYKAFPTRTEAELYISAGKTATTPNAKETIPEIHQEDPGNNHFDIFTDGSYERGKYSWAFVAYQNGNLIHTDSALGMRMWALSSRNVVGELEAVVNAVLWAETQEASGITIHHDYTGPAEWALGKWKTKKRLTQEYAKFIQSRLSWVRFNKVSAHIGIEGNELADKLAGEAIKRALQDS